MKELGVDSSFARSADDAPLYSIEPVAPSAVHAIVAQGGVAPMKVLVNSELQNKAGANGSDRSTRHIEVQLPPGISYRVGDHLSVVPRKIRRWRSVRAPFGFLHGDQIRCRSPKSARANCRRDAVSARLLTEFVELQRSLHASRSNHVGTHALPVPAETLAYVGERRGCHGGIIVRRLARGKSGSICWRHIRPRMPFRAYLEMLSRWRATTALVVARGRPARCGVTAAREAPAIGTRAPVVSSN